VSGWKGRGVENQISNKECRLQKSKRDDAPFSLCGCLRSLRLITSKTEHRGEQVDFRTHYFWLEGKCRVG
jgi:hypothetical protein